MFRFTTIDYGFIEIKIGANIILYKKSYILYIILISWHEFVFEVKPYEVANYKVVESR